MSDALARLVAASADLLVTSESDYPFAPFSWPGPGPLTPAALVAFLGLPPGTPVERGDLGRFFGTQASPRDTDATARAHAARFAALGRLFHQLLAEPALYRVGKVEIVIILAGADAAGNTVGLRSTLIET